MTQVFTKEMEEQLTSEKARLEKDLLGFASLDPNAKQPEFTTDHPEFGDDEDENANEIAAYSNNLPLENALEKELRDTNNALERIKKGTYGVCKYCQGNIAEDRLRARPTASSCIPCKKTLTQEV